MHVTFSVRRASNVPRNYLCVFNIECVSLCPFDLCEFRESTHSFSILMYRARMIIFCLFVREWHWINLQDNCEIGDYDGCVSWDE